MNSTQLSKSAALTAAGLWTAKSVAIAAAGGLDRSPLENPLFFAGLLAFFVGAAAFAVGLTRGRPLPLRVVAAVGAIVAGFVLAAAINALVMSVVSSDLWVWTELNLWVLAVGMLALAFLPGRDAENRENSLA
jgi:hypothetical protein